MKTAIITDSNSGINQQQAKYLGIHVIPMPFTINGTTYYEDIDLTQAEFYEKLTNDAVILTSQPTPGHVMNLWDSLLEEYDEIVYIPMSGGLSGSVNTAKMLAEDYDGRVHVVDNLRISVTQMQSAVYAFQLASEGRTGAEIKEILEAEKLEAPIYITLNTLKYLKKGGRLTPAAAALGTLLQIKPVLQIQGERLDNFAKARTMKQAKAMMLAAIQKDISTRFGNDSSPENIALFIAHTNSPEMAEEFRLELQQLYPEHQIYVDNLSLSVSCHIGPGALGVCALHLNGCKPIDVQGLLASR